MKSQIKRKFYVDVVKHGWTKVEEVPVDYMPEISREMLTQWHKKLGTTSGAKLSENPRMVNRFLIGADPEFVLLDHETGTKIPGNNLGLKTGLGFGVDSNGRLIEVRPEPSRSCLDVLASVTDSLRWFYLACTLARAYDWVAGAYIDGDGLGGHVHLGRKSNARTKEIASLDILNDMLVMLGVYSKTQNDRRRAGDQFRQRYGLPGDVRPQVYGYEYRTYPSWLDNPWGAYLTLVLTKLVAHDPGCWESPVDTPKQAMSRVRNLLSKWHGLDDDAAIAAQALQVHGIPRFIDGDFKGRWGIPDLTSKQVKVPQLLPVRFSPTKQTREELFCHLTGNVPLKASIPEPNWEKTELPKGYHEMLTLTETVRVTGIGEILSGLCGHAKAPLRVRHTDGTGIRIGKMTTPYMLEGGSARLRKQFPRVNILANPEDGWISLGTDLRSVTGIRTAREILLSGEFPLWESHKVEESTIAEWLKKVEESHSTKKHKFASRFIIGKEQ